MKHLIPAHLGHVPVKNDELELLEVAQQLSQALLAVMCKVTTHLQLLKEAAQHLAHGGVILNNEERRLKSSVCAASLFR